jgi:hypothetical protein
MKFVAGSSGSSAPDGGSIRLGAGLAAHYREANLRRLLSDPYASSEAGEALSRGR